MSEFSANKDLTETARLRILRDGEDINEGEPMPVAERRRRQHEARAMSSTFPPAPGDTGKYAALPAFLKRQAE